MDFESTHSTGYAFQIEMTYRALHAGGRIDEVPIAFTDRVRGTSKMSSRIVAEAMTLVTLWGLRDRVCGSSRPHRKQLARPDANVVSVFEGALGRLRPCFGSSVRSSARS